MKNRDAYSLGYIFENDRGLEWGDGCTINRLGLKLLDYGLIDQKLVKALEEIGLLVVLTNIDINQMKFMATTSIMESTSNFEK